MKDFTVGVTCLATFVAGTVAGWQTQLEWGLKIVSLVAAVGASVAAFIYYRAKTRKLRDRSLD